MVTILFICIIVIMAINIITYIIFKNVIFELAKREKEYYGGEIEKYEYTR